MKFKGICQVEECQSRILAKGMCHLHYYRKLHVAKVTGSKIVRIIVTKQWFLSSIKEIKGPFDTPCWEWQRTSRYGYATISVTGCRNKLAHRVGYELFIGQIPYKAWVLHNCNNKLCVNPDHLSLHIKSASPRKHRIKFIKNKYYRWYYQIVGMARKRGKPDLYERHHVIPRRLGGSDTWQNIVYLTYREHYLVHWLLTKIIKDEEARKKMLLGLYMMAKVSESHKGRMPPSWLYIRAKKAFKEARIGFKHSEGAKAKLRAAGLLLVGKNNPFFGKKHTTETLHKMRNRATIRSNLGIRGVSKKKDGYSARMSIGGKVRYLGLFKTAEEASRAYETALLTGKFPTYKQRRPKGMICLIEGCAMPQKKKGLCDKHYWRVYHGSGDPHTTRIIPWNWRAVEGGHDGKQ